MTSKTEIDLQLLDLDAFGDMEVGSWDVPDRLEIRDGELHWGTTTRSKSVSRLTNDFLSEFLDLGGLDDDTELESRVLRYARKWGPLHLCEAHGLPETHTQPVNGLFSFELFPRTECAPKVEPTGTNSEPIELWREISRRAWGLHRSRVEAQVNGTTSDATKGEIADSLPPGLKWTGFSKDDDHEGVSPFSIRGAWTTETAVSASLRYWLWIGGVKPTVKFVKSGLVLGLEASTVYGALGLRIAGDLMNARPTVRCRYCGNLYRQTRRGTFFCGRPKCDKERKRHIQRNSRARLAARDHQHE